MKDDFPCTCSCCEYRQFVKGHMKYSFGGKETNGSPTVDYKKGPNGLEPVTTDGKDFVEDATGDPGNPGNPLGRGRRNNTHARVIGGQPQILQEDYTTLCSYWALDFPNWTVPKGSIVDIDMTWEGRIVDICNKDAIVSNPSPQWTWKFSGLV